MSTNHALHRDIRYYIEEERMLRWLASVIMLVLIFPMPRVHAQTAYGTLLGTVKDASGAVIAGARVTVTNLGTNVSKEFTTGAQGDYTVPNLLPGRYEVTVEVAGFKKFVSSDLILLVDQKLRVDAVLEPGSVTTSVQVTARGQMVDTDSSTLGTVVENKQLRDLPLVSRNYLGLVALAPGTVVGGGPGLPGTGSFRSAQGIFRSALSGGPIFIGGARAASNSYLIDGVENNDPAFQTPAITPPIDSIQEFKVMSKTYSAEYGGSAAQVNVATKSGTNQLHGTAYEFLRNDALNARNFFDAFNPLTGRSKPQLRYNQFGASVGGPIVIPKLVNGRNKLFFFANYEGTRQRQFITARGKYPTPAELKGDFSADPLIYDPQTGLQFPGNIIPSSRIDPKSQQIIGLGLFPTPNVPTQPGFNTLKFLAVPEDTDQLVTRTDAKLSDRDTIFVRYSLGVQHSFNPAIPPFAGLALSQKGQNATLSYIHIFSPRAVNEFRLGFSRPVTFRGQEGAFTSNLAGSLFQGTDQAPITYGAPLFTFQDFSAVGGTPNGPLGYLTNSWSFVDGLSLTRGKHSIKVGFDIRTFLFRVTNAFRPRGQAAFSGLFTGGPGNPSGNAIADFMLGLPVVAAVNQGIFTNWDHGKAYNFYGQDDWRISPRLTLNMGLRYEYRTPLTEELDRVSIFDPTYPGGRLLTPNQAAADQLGSPLVAGSAQRGLVNPDYNNFAPRFGFAFRPFGDNRTVLRGGYGVFYDNFEFNEYSFSYINPPWQKSSQLNGTLTNPVDFGALFPSGKTPLPVAGAMSSLSLDKSNRTPYIQQWSFSAERELAQDWVAEVGYMGSKGTKLDMRTFPSQGILQQSGPNPVVVKPYYNFGFLLVNRTEGVSSYNAAYVRLEKRFKQGYYFQAHYTFSKSLDMTSSDGGIGSEITAFAGPQNAWDLRNDYGLSAFDATHRVVVSGIWELPFGRGKRFASGLSGIADKLISGWQVNSIFQAQSGMPFSVLAVDVSGTRSSLFPRADLVGNPHLPDPADPSRYLNRSAFAQPKPGTFGNSGRNILRGKGLDNFDLSLFKNTPLTERANLQFRAEFFNAFNHTQLGPFPGNVFSLSPTSQFGVFLATNHDARVIQMALKVVF